MDPVDPDQAAPIVCLTKRLLKHFSRRRKQTTFVVISALRVIFGGTYTLSNVFPYPVNKGRFK